MKPTIIGNEVVTVSFGSSQFVIFVDSGNRTDDVNIALNGSQSHPAKTTQKCSPEKIQSCERKNVSCIQFSEVLSSCKHHIADKSVFIDSKNPPKA